MDTRARQLGVDFLLLMVTVFWGASFILVKQAVAQVEVFAFLFLRFALAFVLMLLLFHRRLWPLSGQALAAGSVLGLLLFGAFAFQTWGLTLTTATNGAFITGLNVAMVPILCLVVLRKPPARLAVAGVGLASAGLYVLTGMGSGDWNLGDLLVLVCALWVAFHILLTGHYAPRLDPLALATWQLGAVALLSLGFSGFRGSLTLDLPPSVWWALGLTAGLATVIAFAVQTYAQRTATPTRTALIFTGEPVFGALFAHFYGGEPLLRHHLLGGGLIFLGILLAEIRPESWRRA